MHFRFRVALLTGVFLCAGAGHAQTFTGMLDGYWSYNSNTPEIPLNSFRAFDQVDQSFSLNYGELTVDYKPEDVGFRLDFGFGDAAEIIHSREPVGHDLWRHIEQAYITGTKDKLTVDFGKFVTPVGAEVIETPANWNYTRGLLFTLGIPRYHFGARSTYAASGNVTLSGYIVNGWDNVRDVNTAKSVGFEGIFKPVENVSVTTNVLFGKESFFTDATRQLYDGILDVTVVPGRLWLKANYDYVMDRDESGGRQFWQGVAGYARFKAGNKAILATRYEWFDDHSGIRANLIGSQELQSYTATAQIPWSDITLWGEYRKDWSDLTPFLRSKDGSFTLVDHQNTFTVGLTYAFRKAVN